MPTSSPSSNPAPLVDQSARTDRNGDLPKELRSDARLLTSMLGQVLRESGAEGLFDDVEKLRGLAIDGARGENPDANMREAEQLVASFSPERAKQVARAFTCYFHLVNLVEEYQRVRVLRRAELDDGRGMRPADSMAQAFAELSAEVGSEEAQRRLKALRFHPVFTAHPTEARRTAVTRIINRLTELLDHRDDPRVGSANRADIDRQLLASIDTLWNTSQLRPYNPTPLDEVRTAMAVFDSSLTTVIPKVYRDLDALLTPEGTGQSPSLVHPFVRLGSWISGDRDGNPNVTAAITRQASALMSSHALGILANSTKAVATALTVADSINGPSDDVVSLWSVQRQLSGELTERVSHISPSETHRKVLLVVAERLFATRDRDADLAYTSVDEVLLDLRTVQESLAASGNNRAAYGELQEVIWQVQTFGFHGAELEIRQHAQVHRETLQNLDGEGDEPKIGTQEVLDTFRAVSEIQRRLGEVACSRYIVSFTQSAADIANVFELARRAAGPGREAARLSVIPLFETFDDLMGARATMDDILQLPDVQDYLDGNGRTMEVMLGYSDSAKDVGPVAANLALYTAQEQLADWADENNIELTQFHGRGGALGRGGGPASRALLAQPPGSVGLRFKLTEQGEVITARYQVHEIAARHIESVAAASLLASAPSTRERNSGAEHNYADLATKLDEVSRRRFHDLIYSDGFPQWFAKVTPQEEIGHLAIGSRPARRGLSVESLDDLRAIPWNFAWSQARTNLTGWFGLGTAMEAVGDADMLQDAYRNWPLLATLIDNIEMSLAKAEMRIAARYFELADRPDLAEMVIEEFNLTKKWVLATLGQDTLLGGHPILRRAVELRHPYINALSLLQLRALRVMRDEEKLAELDEADVEDNRKLLLISLKGAAAGLQNTG